MDLSGAAVVVFTEARQVLHRRVCQLSMIWKRRAYGFLGPEADLSRREWLVVEASLGPVVGRLGVPDDHLVEIQAGFADWPGGEQPDRPLGLEWKRASIWHILPDATWRLPGWQGPWPVAMPRSHGITACSTSSIRNSAKAGAWPSWSSPPSTPMSSRGCCRVGVSCGPSHRAHRARIGLRGLPVTAQTCRRRPPIGRSLPGSPPGGGAGPRPMS